MQGPDQNLPDFQVFKPGTLREVPPPGSGHRNYNFFTYNLVQYLGEMKVQMEISRNDQISIDEIRALKPERILISPGPCSPRESGLSNEIIGTFSSQIPTLGVCLGHQCIGHVFGGNVV